MNRYRLISILIFVSSAIQLALGLFIGLTDMVGESESTWVLIALAVCAVISFAAAVYFLRKSDR